MLSVYPVFELTPHPRPHTVVQWQECGDTDQFLRAGFSLPRTTTTITLYWVHYYRYAHAPWSTLVVVVVALLMLLPLGDWNSASLSLGVWLVYLSLSLATGTEKPSRKAKRTSSRYFVTETASLLVSSVCIGVFVLKVSVALTKCEFSRQGRGRPLPPSFCIASRRHFQNAHRKTPCSPKFCQHSPTELD